jgi:hypothetical protein
MLSLGVEAICSILLTFLDKFQDPVSALKNWAINDAGNGCQERPKLRTQPKWISRGVRCHYGPRSIERVLLLRLRH